MTGSGHYYLKGSKPLRGRRKQLAKLWKPVNVPKRGVLVG